MAACKLVCRVSVRLVAPRVRAATVIGLAVGRAAEAPWTGDDFLTAVEAFDITLTVERDAFAPVRLSCESDGHPRIHVGVRISADGTHAPPAAPGPLRTRVGSSSAPRGA